MNSNDIKKGQKFWSDYSGDLYLKIMAIEDKYVMARFKGCVPFCIPLGEFKAKYSSYFYTEKPTHD